MALAHLVVVGVVRRRYLDDTGTELLVDVRIGDDLDLSSYQRQRHLFADKRLVAFVVGMYHHRRIAEVGFGSCRGDDDMSAAVTERIADVIELAFVLFILHLDVAERAVVRTPVDHIVALYDPPFVVHLLEGFFDRVFQTRIHREALSAPCGRNTKLTQLGRDGVAGVLLLLPCAF